MVEIYFINNCHHRVEFYKKMARKLISNALNLLNYQDKKCSLTIHFIEETQALALNEKYRNKDYVPDVLSFPTKMNKNEVQAIGVLELGDIMICLSEAQRKADKYQHSLETEVAFLLVHGFLHLLGFDHEKNQNEEAIMFAWQDKILESANYEYEIKNY